MAVGGKSDQTWMTKYILNAKITYGRHSTEEKMRLLSYMDIYDIKGHEKANATKTGKLVSVGNDGVEYNATTHMYTRTKGIDITDFATVMSMAPTFTDAYLEKGRDHDITTEVEIESNLLMAQADIILEATLSKILTPMKQFCVDGSYEQPDKDGNRQAITIDPATQVFGDVTKTFYENQEQFFRMITRAKVLSKGANMEVNFALVHGENTMVVLEEYDRLNDEKYFQNKEFIKKDGEKIPVLTFRTAEMIPIPFFDSIFGGSATTPDYIVCLLKRAMAYCTNGSNRVDADIDPKTKAKLLFNDLYDGAEISDQDGILIFKYNGVIGNKIVHTKEEV